MEIRKEDGSPLKVLNFDKKFTTSVGENLYNYVRVKWRTEILSFRPAPGEKLSIAGVDVPKEPGTYGPFEDVLLVSEDYLHDLQQCFLGSSSKRFPQDGHISVPDYNWSEGIYKEVAGYRIHRTYQHVVEEVEILHRYRVANPDEIRDCEHYDPSTFDLIPLKRLL